MPKIIDYEMGIGKLEESRKILSLRSIRLIRGRSIIEMRRSNFDGSRIAIRKGR
jgi:hypothetical protein